MILFKIAIVDRNERVAQIQGGGKLEKDLVQLIADCVAEKTWRITTRGRVKAAIEEGLAEAIKQLKQDTVRVL